MSWFERRKLRKAGFEIYQGEKEKSHVHWRLKEKAKELGGRALAYEKANYKGQLLSVKSGVHKTANFFDRLGQAINDTPSPYKRKRY